MKEPMNIPTPCVEYADMLVVPLDQLSASDQAVLEAHIETCPGCSSAYKDYQRIWDLMRTLPPPDFSAPLPSRLVALWEQEGYITEDPTQKPSIGKRFFNGIKKVGVVIAVAGIGIVALGIKAELASRRNLQSEARPTTDRPGSFLPTHHQPVASTHITNVHQSAADQGNYVVDWGRLASQQRQVVADMERQAGLRHVERSRR